MSRRSVSSVTATSLQIELVPCLSDNYSFLIHDPETGVTAAVDPAEPTPFEDILESRGLKLDYILNTHHHGDHVGGNKALKQKYSATVVGPSADKDRIPGIDIALADGDTFQLGAHTLTVYDTPGHTRGHIIYHCPSAEAVFVGDTLFALGCGRLFEGTAAQMFDSLAKIKAMPGATKVYCAHEYTQANARFCLSRPDPSPALVARADEIAALREQNVPTVPTTVQRELETNPFLMVASAAEFAELRTAKDNF
eukprot:CAMPEP_0118960474 /NCGR_PEP_ID=MMETSP1169-20130426/63656_1 /TAXON_ID=36882 /ORGANISM="Pyramimonas obovata, Strain CCMP722" /LENGTH=252 /DNA_ID=CAMNT_0006908623 /DNA_START=167 /DNA_END=925 /DNA_ORIENTATION=-